MREQSIVNVTSATQEPTAKITISRKHLPFSPFVKWHLYKPIQKHNVSPHEADSCRNINSDYRCISVHIEWVPLPPPVADWLTSVLNSNDSARCFSICRVCHPAHMAFVPELMKINLHQLFTSWLWFTAEPGECLMVSPWAVRETAAKGSTHSMLLCSIWRRKLGRKRQRDGGRKTERKGGSTEKYVASITLNDLLM